MRYNKYAMPVHPKVLEKDFKTDQATFFNLSVLTKKLKEIDDLDDLERENKNYLELLLKSLNKFLYKTWFEINLRKGINLKNREMLVPLFKQMNRLFAYGEEFYPDYLYRGVRLSRVLGPTALSDNYPDSINDPEVLEHLESLAYGLRSWTKYQYDAERWAKGIADEDTKSAKGRDLVIFEILSPTIVLDTDEVISYYKSSSHLDIGKPQPMFDDEEVILYFKNPKVVEVSKEKSRPGEPSIYHVVVEDR